MTVLYNIFIVPFVYILKILIYILHPLLLLNPVLAIFTISFIVNFLSYPIFAKIEQKIKEDQEKYQKLLPKIETIKRNFSGYEQRMLLSTYFRQNDYHPLLAHFKQSLIIFLQVPFFVSAYIVICDNFLFQIPAIDQINNSINLWGIPIKILPIIMTIINMLSVRVYTKDKSFSNKLYANSLSILFLVLLYFSPASIVLYWIFNNSFAFLRNTYFYNKKKLLTILIIYAISVISLAFFVLPKLSTVYFMISIILLLLFLKFMNFILKDVFYIINFTLFLLIYFAMFAPGYLPSLRDIISYIITLLIFIALFLCYKYFIKNNDTKITTSDYILYQFPIVLIFGLYVPIKLINSSVIEYFQLINIKDLSIYIFEVCLGIFLIYPSLIFYIQKKYRLVISYISIIVSCVALKTLYTEALPSDTINVFAQFSLTKNFEISSQDAFSLFYILTIIIFVSLIFKFKLLKYIKIVITALICVYIYNIGVEIVALKSNIIELQKNDKIEHRFSLSTKGKNVLVILLDRAISGFLPQIMAEKPEFKQIFTGFTYYPYTVSFAAQTLYSSPSLFGGYEYTPLKLQQDTTRTIVDKHNEAISVVSEIFRRNDYHITLYDMPYINYENKKAKRFYHKDINVINNEHLSDSNDNITALIKKNTLNFIIFRMCPYIYKDKIYNQGIYFETTSNQINYTIEKEYKNFESFLENIKIKDTSDNNYVFFYSMITHSPSELSIDYDFDMKKEKNIDKSRSVMNMLHYNANMLAYIEVGKLLNKLKENNVYDNTRIIIMSDHGFSISDIKNVDEGIAPNNSLLFTKDFNATGEYKTNYEFMTTADIPYLTVVGIDEKLINPMTNKKLLPEKDNGVDIITSYLPKWSPKQYEEKNRTYLYDEEVKYMHIDEKIIKELIKIDTQKGN